jgi:hypothetical protein
MRQMSQYRGFASRLIGQTRDMARHSKKAGPKGFRSAVRDAVTGRFVSKKAAKRRPKTTVTERIRFGRNRSGKKGR